MKKILFSLLLGLFNFSLIGQPTFKSNLEVISTDLCSKIASKGKKKIVVLFITDINKTQTNAGKYMADVVSYHIVNDPKQFSVFDRENLSGIAEAKKMIAEGYIDGNNAKQLGRILAVETIVVGNYTVLSNTISLTLKALDVNDGFVIAQSMKDLPIDNDAGALLGISVGGAGASTANKGFNRPLSSDESYNNPETVNRDCEIKNTGDYCFKNNTKYNVRVEVFDKGSSNQSSLTLNSNQTQCLYNLKSSSMAYKTWIYNGAKPLGYDFKKGQILVEKCKSKTFVIQ